MISTLSQNLITVLRNYVKHQELLLPRFLLVMRLYINSHFSLYIKTVYVFMCTLKPMFYRLQFPSLWFWNMLKCNLHMDKEKGSSDVIHIQSLHHLQAHVTLWDEASSCLTLLLSTPAQDLWNSFTYLADLSIWHDLGAPQKTRTGLTKSHAAWLKNDSPGNVGWKYFLCPLSLRSQVNSTGFRRTLWIQPRLCREQSTNMAGWLCTVGVGDILIHVCISACGVLYIHLMNVQLPSRHTSEESHRGAVRQYISIIHCLLSIPALSAI